MLYKALPQVKRYTQEELIRAMDLLLRCNQRLVSSSLDESLVLQQTLVQIVGNTGAASSRGCQIMSLCGLTILFGNAGMHEHTLGQNVGVSRRAIRLYQD